MKKSVNTIDPSVPVDYEIRGDRLYRTWFTSDRSKVPTRCIPFKPWFRELLCAHPGGHETCIEIAEARRVGDDLAHDRRYEIPTRTLTGFGLN